VLGEVGRRLEPRGLDGGEPALLEFAEVVLVGDPPEHARVVQEAGHGLGPPEELLGPVRVVGDRQDDAQPGRAPVDRRVVPHRDTGVDPQRSQRVRQADEIVGEIGQVTACHEGHPGFSHAAQTTGDRAGRTMPPMPTGHDLGGTKVTDRPRA